MKITRFPLIGLLAITAACSYSGYTGDGVLVDGGWTHFVSRYEVRLGSVDLAKDHEHTFVMRSLPAREFVVGLKLNPSDCKLMGSDQRISIRLADEKGAIVVQESHALREMTWETNYHNECDAPFGYVLTKGTEISDGHGNTCGQPTITGADGGHGSYFNSRSEGVYRLSFSSDPSDSSPGGPHLVQVLLEDTGPLTTGTNGCD